MLSGVITGTETTVKAAVNGLLRVHPSNRLYFTGNGGKAIRLAGHQIFCDMQDHAFGIRFTYNYQSTLDWDWYMNFMTERNLNFIRNWALFSFGYGQNASDSGQYCIPLPYARTGPGNAFDGRPKFDLYTFNQSYFDRLHTRLQDAGNRGIYVSIMLFDLYNFINTQGFKYPYRFWDGNVFNPENNINGINADSNCDGEAYEFFNAADQTILDLQRAYIRKVIDTVNDLDNVFYEAANEVYAPSWQNDTIDYIKSYEAGKSKQHLILKSCGGMEQESEEGTAGSPADIFTISGHWPGYSLTDAPANTHGKPGIWDTDHDEPENNDYRRPWTAFTRGYHYNLYDFPFEVPDQENEEWERVRYNAGATVLYANRTDFAAMYPRNDLSSTTYCLADPGNEYIVFQRDSSDSFTVSELVAEDPYYYEWFDTYNYKVASSGNITFPDKTHTFYPSYINAVLYLKKCGSRHYGKLCN